jgi:hypothetical protein
MLMSFSQFTYYYYPLSKNNHLPYAILPCIVSMNFHRTESLPLSSICFLLWFSFYESYSECGFPSALETAWASIPWKFRNVGSSHMLVYVYHVSETAVVWSLRELIPVIKIGILVWCKLTDLLLIIWNTSTQVANHEWCHHGKLFFTLEEDRQHLSLLYEYNRQTSAYYRQWVQCENLNK